VLETLNITMYRDFWLYGSFRSVEALTIAIFSSSIYQTGIFPHIDL